MTKRDDGGAAKAVEDMEDAICQHIKNKKGWVADRIECADGTSISVQGSSSHYSRPRIDGAPLYFEVEVGYPSVAPPDDWQEHCEEWDSPTNTVYAYVPIGRVARFIIDHGGIAARTQPGQGERGE